MPKKKKKETKKRIKKIKATFARQRVFSEKTSESNDLYEKSRFGEHVDNKIQYSLVEAFYLLEKKRMQIKDYKNKVIKPDNFIKKAQKVEPNFWIRYTVFRDLRNRGYIVKTALKFGADFRVYDRGVKPGEDHAKWIVYPVHEGEILTWRDFAAKNRVAHSTRKKLLLAVVDEENDCSFWQCEWTKP